MHTNEEISHSFRSQIAVTQGGDPIVTVLNSITKGSDVIVTVVNSITRGGELINSRHRKTVCKQD
jgi:hypothetical protein